MTDDITIFIEGQGKKSVSLYDPPTKIGEDLSNLYGYSQWSPEKVCNVITQLARAYQNELSQLKQQIENLNEQPDPADLIPTDIRNAQKKYGR